MDIDDISRQMLIVQLEAEYLEVIAGKAQEYEPPDWFLIGNGLKESDSKTRIQAAIILKEFIRFSQGDTGLSFKELVEAFTAAKAHNKITQDNSGE